MVEVASEGGASGSRSPVLATVDLREPDRAADDLVEAVQTEGMDGLFLSANPPGVSDLADPALAQLWAAAEQLGVPIMVHPPTVGPAARIPASEEFGNVFGRLIDTTFAAARLIVSGVLDRHPGLALILVHGGGLPPVPVDPP